MDASEHQIQKLETQLNHAKTREERINIASSLGQIHASHENFVEAIKSYAQILSYASHSERAALLSNIAVMHRRNGNYKEALRAYNQALEILRNDLKEPENKQNIGMKFQLFTTLQNMVTIHRRLREFEASFEVYNEMLVLLKGTMKDIENEASDQMRALHSNACYALARLHNNIGSVYSCCGQTDAAFWHYLESASVFKMIYNSEMCKDHGDDEMNDARRGDMAEPLSNLGKIHLSRSELTEAMNAWTEALHIQQEVFGYDSPIVVKTLANIAVVQQQMGHLNDALFSHKEILKLRSQILENGHPDIANTLNNIGNIRLYQGQLNEAMELYSKALIIGKSAFDTSLHPLVAGTLQNIACVYYRQERYVDALSTFEKAFETLKAVRGENHVEVGEMHLHLGKIQQKLGRPDEAMKNYIQTMHIFETNNLGENHPSVKVTIHSIDRLEDDNDRSSQETGDHGEYHDGNVSLDDSQSTDLSDLARLDRIVESVGSGVPQSSMPIASDRVSARNGEQQHRTSNNSPKSSGSTHSKSAASTRRIRPHVRVNSLGSQSILSLISDGDNNGETLTNDRTIMVFIEKLKAQEANLGILHPDTAQTLVDVGDIFFERGSNNKSIKIYQEALLLQRGEFGNDHVDVAGTVSKLADVYVKKGFYEQAMESYREALDVYRKIGLDESHPNVKRIIQSIDDTLDEERRSF